MNLPKDFEYYLLKGIVRKITPDMPRAKFLIEESEISFEGLKEAIQIIGINNKNANLMVKNCYDILMGLIRAKLLFEGYVSSGNYAHEAEISYLKKINFSDNEISFLNELRHFRNSVTYYGKILDKEYAEKIAEFTKKNYLKLKKLVNKKR
ncbi:MAG TPA: hypothetical protein VJ208_00940 [Candidatus Nanoarchaeia archaeon]|nr:hypothetical protein [Candidatus Nanoarchaeia archaeon]